MSIADEKIQKLKFSGAVDADGHILEDAGLWDRYIEAKYKFTPQFFGALRWNQQLFSTIPVSSYSRSPACVQPSSLVPLRRISAWRWPSTGSDTRMS